MQARIIKTAADMLSLGAELARSCKPGSIIYLSGELGTGKTTLTRGFLRELGYQGVVKSPTYALVETYQFAKSTVYHFDLYRLTNPSELEFIWIHDYFTPDSICLIEWPERGGEFLPPASLTCNITLASPQHRLIHFN